MTRLIFGLLLLVLLPVSALADSGPDPTVGVDLDFDPPTESANVKDVQLKTAKGMNPPLKVLPLALGLPLMVAGLSVANTSPIAHGEGFGLIYPGLRRAGLGLMGTALTANILMNTLARTARLFSGGEWQKDIEFLVAGISAAAAGYVLVSVGTSIDVLSPDGARLLDDPGAVGGILVGASVAWTVGNLLMIVDSIKTAQANEGQLAARRRRAGPRFAGVWFVPTLEGGAAGGIGFAW